MIFDFKNRNVIITGGSRGIGSYTAKLFASAGATVIFTYKSNKAAADNTMAELGAGRHSTYALDVADADAIQGFFSWYNERYDKLDILVNNAAIFTEHKILSTSYKHWQQSWNQTLGANLCGPANMCFLLRKI